jgi:hypothetical protein
MRNRSNRLFSGILYTVALAFALLLTTQLSQAAIGIGVSINIAPPELPVYEQPPVPGPGYIWTPGYWAWGDNDYYWVPGTWVEAPQPGYLWTPGYWGWNDGLYVWNGGYWGPHIGFYGGVNYGFGYIGHGYEGGYWDHGAFRYNSAYNNLHGDAHITNVYNHTVIVDNNHVSFNGGHGGIQARPAPNELAAQHEQHLAPLPAQIQHEQGARSNPALRAAANHGRPPIAATAHAGVFTGHGVVPARTSAPAHSSTAPPAHHAVGATTGMAPHGGAPGATVQHGGAPTGGMPGGGAPAGHPGGGAPPPHATPHPPQHEPAEKERPNER